uniref:Serine proteinase n=1 Tax=Hadrurus spadix TaxID=141984 RepID=A0A1W7RA11_9SCOR
MDLLERTIDLLILFFCSSVAFGDWVDDYKKDERPLCPTGSENEDRRIYGGKHAGVGTFPFAVGILKVVHEKVELYNIFCAGSMITDLHVLTASHCFKPERVTRYWNTMRVTIGDYDIEDPNEVKSYLRKIHKLNKHPEERPFMVDLAILTLDEAIPLDEGIRMPVLPPFGRKLDGGTICTVWGWGLTPDYDLSTIMLKVDVPIISAEDCKNIHISSKNMICAGGKKGEDSCQGDSGGSLLLKEENAYCLVGVVSSGPELCGSEGEPGIYVNVSRFTDWIYENTKGATCKPHILQ